jgi:hypothetical protein
MPSPRKPLDPASRAGVGSAPGQPSGPRRRRTPPTRTAPATLCGHMVCHQKRAAGRPAESAEPLAGRLPRGGAGPTKSGRGRTVDLEAAAADSLGALHSAVRARRGPRESPPVREGPPAATPQPVAPIGISGAPSTTRTCDLLVRNVDGQGRNPQERRDIRELRDRRAGPNGAFRAEVPPESPHYLDPTRGQGRRPAGPAPGKGVRHVPQPPASPFRDLRVSFPLPPGCRTTQLRQRPSSPTQPRGSITSTWGRDYPHFGTVRHAAMSLGAAAVRRSSDPIEGFEMSVQRRKRVM